MPVRAALPKRHASCSSATPNFAMCSCDGVVVRAAEAGIVVVGSMWFVRVGVVARTPFDARGAVGSDRRDAVSAFRETTKLEYDVIGWESKKRSLQLGHYLAHRAAARAARQEAPLALLREHDLRVYCAGLVADAQ